MRYTKFLILLALCAILGVSCSNQLYYSRVKKNIAQFDIAVTDIRRQQLLLHNDSIRLNGDHVHTFDYTCLYQDDKIHDSLLVNFFRRYGLTKICISRQFDKYFDSVIVFHRDYTPFFGKAITINCNFGKSGLRDSIEAGIGINGIKAKTINDKYVYIVKKNPAFGE
jgi:hypothetical protein